MVTNVPPRCAEYYKKYEEAQTTKEKIVALEDLIGCIPKHKGTEKLLKDLKLKLAKLRAELAKEAEARKSRTSTLFSLRKKGDGQVVLLGTPYVGKTSIVNRLTGSKYAIGRPTQIPQDGIFKWEGCEFHIVDTPPILSDDIDKTPNGRAIMGIAYNSDLVGLVIDVTQDIDWQLSTLISAMQDANITLRPKPPIEVKKLSRGGITIIGHEFSPFSIEELKEILASYRLVNCIVEFKDHVSEFDLYLALNPKIAFKKGVIILNKVDAADDENKILEYVKGKLSEVSRVLPIIPFSVYRDNYVDLLGRTIFEEMNLLRVWTKKGGKVNRDRALVLRRPATVRDACEKIHNSFVEKFRYAVIEREGSPIKHKIVGLDYELQDGDILTIYTKD
ncbi:MAG: TGS domain-containing protein [Candidatus Korarchaeota archaeon]|nr:TGS domain-containing protein [Thermoproteota archaeon]